MSETSEQMFTTDEGHRTGLSGAFVVGYFKGWTAHKTGREFDPVAPFANDAPALSDAALVEEAARRGMTVMDAAEAARLRGVAERAPRLWDVDATRIMDAVDALADEFQLRASLDRDEAVNRSGVRYTQLMAEARVLDVAAARLRALLSADDEAVE